MDRISTHNTEGKMSQKTRTFEDVMWKFEKLGLADYLSYKKGSGCEACGHQQIEGIELSEELSLREKIFVCLQVIWAEMKVIEHIQAQRVPMEQTGGSLYREWGESQKNFNELVDDHQRKIFPILPKLEELLNEYLSVIRSREEREERICFLYFLSTVIVCLQDELWKKYVPQFGDFNTNFGNLISRWCRDYAELVAEKKETLIQGMRKMLEKDLAKMSGKIMGNKGEEG